MKLMLFPVPLCIKLLQINGYVKYFNRNSKCINPLVHDNELLKKCNEVCNKISNILKKSSILNQCTVATTLKLIYSNRIDTQFQGNKIPESNEYCTGLSVTLSYSVINIDNDYDP